MTAADRDLVAALRGELAAIDSSRPCDREAERAGLGAGGRSRDPVVARLAVRLARRGRSEPTAAGEGMAAPRGDAAPVAGLAHSSASAGPGPAVAAHHSAVAGPSA